MGVSCTVHVCQRTSLLLLSCMHLLAIQSVHALLQKQCESCVSGCGLLVSEPVLDVSFRSTATNRTLFTETRLTRAVPRPQSMQRRQWCSHTTAAMGWEASPCGSASGSRFCGSALALQRAYRRPRAGDQSGSPTGGNIDVFIQHEINIGLNLLEVWERGQAEDGDCHLTRRHAHFS